MNQKRITIAIDGFSACGKSTLAKDLAKRLGYVFIDSGAMYRAAALYCLRNNLIVNGQLNKEEILPKIPKTPEKISLWKRIKKVLMG